MTVVRIAHGLQPSAEFDRLLVVPAYVVVDVTRTDLDKATCYMALSGPSVERHGGRFVVRGGDIHVFEGAWDPERIVIIEFASVEAAQEWYDSDDYRVARAVREGAGIWNMIVVPGATADGAAST